MIGRGIRNIHIVTFVAFTLAIGVSQGALAASVDDWCVAIRVCDPPAAPTVTYDILCDRTASCTEQNLRTTIEDALHACASRPGSVVRLWMMGRLVTDTTLVASARNETGDRKGKKKKALSAQRFVDRELPRMVAAAQMAMTKPAPNASPIAESLTVVSWAEVDTDLRVIVALTDGKQMSPSSGSFECRVLPEIESWLRTLATHRCLTPHVLDGVSVHFAFVGVQAVSGRGCSVSLQRETEIRELWRAAIERAGGTLSITTGPARLTSQNGGGAK